MRFEDFKKEFEGSLLSEGWRGRIYRGVWKGEEVAIKVAKSPYVVGAIRKEAHLLSLLKGLENFPQILHSGEDFFVYRFIDGMPLRYVDLEVEEEKRVLREILKCAFRLDEMGISKDEFSYIDKNVLIGKYGEVYIIDFERGKISKRPTNLTQFIQLLRRKGYVSEEEVIRLGKRCRTNREEVYRDLLERLK